MTNELLERLVRTASRTAWYDEGEEFSPDDYAGGNIDDAYNGGLRDGEIELAREILDNLGISYTK